MREDNNNSVKNTKEGEEVIVISSGSES